MPTRLKLWQEYEKEREEDQRREYQAELLEQERREGEKYNIRPLFEKEGSETLKKRLAGMGKTTVGFRIISIKLSADYEWRMAGVSVIFCNRDYYYKVTCGIRLQDFFNGQDFIPADVFAKGEIKEIAGPDDSLETMNKEEDER